ncbi:hypothetical protein CJ030_MR7G002010 [Morella rubra]|uniref:PGG domain-containing protein n=1 Tax=Morella rubra TaxID=262757 RepID=A0A6A1WUE5_9ROSI|nr:hypothetical protein CJ030_MR7G002010 [Morella rubra]
MVNLPNGSDRRRGRLTLFFRKLIIPTSLPFLGYEEPSNEIRSNLLVAAALIAAVTFQASMAPPAGVWQDDEKEHVAGRSIYSSQRVPFYVFLICNTMVFSSSIHLLLCLTFGYPYFLEVLAATASMGKDSVQRGVFKVNQRSLIK